jgi:antitoxin ParD1/3/4
MATITISLPDNLRDFVENQTANKGYGNVSEYFRSLLREAQAKDNDERLKTLLLEGLASGEGQAVTPEFWADLRSEAMSLLDTTGKKGRT